MRIDLTAPELALFDALASSAGSVVSFGANALVCRAASLVGSAVVAVDGSRERLAEVAAECRTHADWTQPHLVHADIGPMNGAGHPTDATTKDRWPLYHERVWNVPGSDRAELYVLGGRFRVACALETLLRCRQDAVIFFQTYRARREYHSVATFAREIAGAEGVAAFVPRPDRDAPHIRAMLERFRLVTV